MQSQAGKQAHSGIADFDDGALATRLRAGDADAIAAVVRTYLPQVLRAARGAGFNPLRAEDLAQETFATFVEKIGNFDGRSRARTWLFGIFYRKVLEHRRAAQREADQDDIDQVLEQRFRPDGTWLQPPAPVDAGVYREQIRRWLQECLDAVPARQRLAFLLRQAEGYPSQEVCDILDVTRTNLGAMLHRCRNRLRECLEAKGVRGSRDAAL